MQFICSLLDYTTKHFFASLHLGSSAFNNCMLKACVLQAQGLLINMLKSEQNKFDEKQTIS
jgi:hypothetical protein